MKALNLHRTGLNRRGYSLLEVLVVVAAVGILTGIAIGSLGSRPGEVFGRAKLESDIKTVNAAVANYRAFGGKLDGVVEPGHIIAKLKSEASSESARVLPGLAGSFLDPRVVPVMQSEAEARSMAPRALWNAQKYRFEVTDSGGVGVKEFRFDSAAEFVLVEARMGSMDYARENGWIWDYQDRVALRAPVPFAAKTKDVPVVIGETKPAHWDRAQDEPKILQAPSMSLPGGSYPVTEFDLLVTLSDPNPRGAGRIVYENGNGWMDYEGGSIRVEPGSEGSELSARVVPIDTHRWTMSPVAVESYEATPARLESPQIIPDSPAFDPGVENLSVSLVNPNDPNVSEIYYRVGDGPWTLYTDPFGLSRVSDFGAEGGTDEVTLEAYAKGISDYYLDSAAASLSIPRHERRLDPPWIAFDHDSFGSSVEVIEVTLTDPNQSGTSRIRFQIAPVPAPGGGTGPVTGFMTYTGPFTVSRALYPDGFEVEAFAEASAPGYVDSDSVNRFASDQKGLFGGHLDLDTSTFISKIGNGSTSAHTHDITGKYGISTIDLFAIPDSKQIDLDEAITDPDARFKLTVVNGKLSPGLTLSITYRAGGVTQVVEKPVDQYGDIGLEDLETFTLGGAPGTAKLESLKLKMSKDVIYEAAVIPTVTGDVRSNEPGKNGEWRNGALTVQAVQVNADGSDGFTTEVALSNGGVHGAATGGMLWEVAVFWHWDGDAYHENNNRYVPGDFSTIRDGVDDH